MLFCVVINVEDKFAIDALNRMIINSFQIIHYYLDFISNLYNIYNLSFMQINLLDLYILKHILSDLQTYI